jgi:hypothetical protein
MHAQQLQAIRIATATRTHGIGWTREGGVSISLSAVVVPYLAYSNCTISGASTVEVSDELSAEARAILVFLKRYFNSAGMPNALWIFKESENISDVRAILDSYREFYNRHGRN